MSRLLRISLKRVFAEAKAKAVTCVLIPANLFRGGYCFQLVPASSSGSSSVRPADFPRAAPSCRASTVACETQPLATLREQQIGFKIQ